MRLVKYHGLGNDFLILLDLDGRERVDAERARKLCDRHRGVGADGLIRVTAGRDGADVSMQLWNADGSEAATSGNGLRCVARAVVDAGMRPGPELVVLTAAGRRRVTVEPDRRISVDMGAARVEDALVSIGERASHVDMGNPHLVLLDDGHLDVTVLGPRHPDVNVEVVSGAGDELAMRVWERGVGETLACGTGSCAAAAAARAWGVVGGRVRVHNAGGTLEVRLNGTGVVLAGPVRRVCAVEVDIP